MNKTSLPEDGNKQIDQQYVSDEQVDAKQYRCRPFDAVDHRVVVVHLLTYVVCMGHTRRVAYVATYVNATQRDISLFKRLTLLQ